MSGEGGLSERMVGCDSTQWFTKEKVLYSNSFYGTVLDYQSSLNTSLQSVVANEKQSLQHLKHMLTFEGMQPTFKHVPPSVSFFSMQTVYSQREHYLITCKYIFLSLKFKIYMSKLLCKASYSSCAFSD